MAAREQRYNQGARQRLPVAQLLETGVFGTIDELATAEKINPSYVSRILRLALLAPHIVEGILIGRQYLGVTLGKRMEKFPLVWEQQAAVFRQDERRPGEH
jgi:hypothetical protein